MEYSWGFSVLIRVEQAPSVMAEEMVHDCCCSSSKLGAIFCRQENVSLDLVTSRKLHRFLDC